MTQNGPMKIELMFIPRFAETLSRFISAPDTDALQNINLSGDEFRDLRGAIMDGMEGLMNLAEGEEIAYMLNAGWRCDCDHDQFCVNVCDQRTRGDGLNIEIAALSGAGALAAGILTVQQHRLWRSNPAEPAPATPDDGTTDGTELLKLRRLLFQLAPSHQGGHSVTSAAIAEALGVPFPVRVFDLKVAAIAEGFDWREMWPWLVNETPEPLAMVPE